MNNTYIPTGNRILIKKIKIEEKTQSGIILSYDIVEQKEKQNQTGEILALGYNVKKELGLQIGYKIAFAKYSETILNDSEQIGVVSDENVLAIIKENHNETK